MNCCKSASLIVLGVLILSGMDAQEAGAPSLSWTPQAPPPAPPIEHQTYAQPAAKPQGGFAQALYSIGQPTDEEQLYLEYINRSRSNPPTEGARLATSTDPDVLSAYSYFGVNLALLQSEFNTNLAVPPLAMNAQLIAAARWHSGDMFTNQYQGHYQTNGSIVMAPGDRAHTNGYNWSTIGENVFSFSKTVFYGHAGFNVDWGPGPGGMQDPAGHRENIQSADFREVGVGVVDGTNGAVGPQLVTQDFGTVPASTPFITGVVYYDFNTNGFYDVGEGVGGVTVSSPGSSYYAVTPDSGGYAIPVTTNGNYTLTFSAPGLSTQRVVTVAGLQNVKVDFVPGYSSPAIAGPNPAYLNTSNLYAFPAVGAATGYQWLQIRLGSPATEGAENGLTNVTLNVSSGYSVLASDYKYSGAYSFHLAHNPTDQILALNPTFRASTNTQLRFAKYLGLAFTNEVARAQVSLDGGQSWQDVWSQGGNAGGSPVDSGWGRITNSLASYAGQSFQVRFVFSFNSGYYYSPASGVGLYLDDLAVANADQLLTQITNTTAGTAFAFSPTNATNYLLMVRAQISSRTLAWGPALKVSVVNPPPMIQFVSKPLISSGQIQLDFTVANYRSNMTFQLWKLPDLTGAWAQDNSAALTTLIANSKFRYTTATGAVSKTFYKVKGSY